MDRQPHPGLTTAESEIKPMENLNNQPKFHSAGSAFSTCWFGRSVHDRRNHIDRVDHWTDLISRGEQRGQRADSPFEQTAVGIPVRNHVVSVVQQRPKAFSLSILGRSVRRPENPQPLAQPSISYYSVRSATSPDGRVSVLYNLFIDRWLRRSRLVGVDRNIAQTTVLVRLASTEPNYPSGAGSGAMLLL